MSSVFDLHVHTNQGSPDSSLTPQEMVAEASRVGLTGIMVTEHVGWPRADFDAFARDQDLILVRAAQLSLISLQLTRRKEGKCFTSHV